VSLLFTSNNIVTLYKYILRYLEKDLVKILKDSSYHSKEWEETDPEEEWLITQSAVEDDGIIEELIKQKSSSIYIYNKWWHSSALLRLLHDD
ncbi:hypothetical protein RhiirB3_461714, partial [Rhizophagus irregularis]